MFLTRDLGIMVLPERGEQPHVTCDKDKKKPRKDGGFTTCGGFTCLSPTNCGPDPCDCGAKHSCNPGGTCANNTKECVTRSLPKTVETEVEASLDAIDFYLEELRKQLARSGSGKSPKGGGRRKGRGGKSTGKSTKKGGTLKRGA